MPAFAVTDNLEWTVSKRPLFFTGVNGQPVQWDQKVAIVRDDNDRGLGTVSPDFEIVQNSTLMGLIKPLEEEGLLKINNVGHLQHGATVFIQAKIQEEFQVVGESYESYITFLNGHVGNKSVAIGTTTYRVICGNTFALAYSDISEKFRHQAGVNEKVLETQAVNNYVNACMGKYAQSVERLANRRCDSADLRTAIDRVFGEKFDAEKKERVRTLFHNGRGNEGASLYDAFNAITDFTSHEVRKTSKAQFQYVNFGSGARINERAFSVLTEMAVA
jgi:phage/plasmid-like protein (TIGR03299 family)